MACFGELFRLCQSIPNAFKKNRASTMRYTNSVAEFRDEPRSATARRTPFTTHNRTANMG
jgi:hypothetical protein